MSDPNREVLTTSRIIARCLQGMSIEELREQLYLTPQELEDEKAAMYAALENFQGWNPR